MIFSLLTKKQQIPSLAQYLLFLYIFVNLSWQNIAFASITRYFSASEILIIFLFFFFAKLSVFPAPPLLCLT